MTAKRIIALLVLIGTIGTGVWVYRRTSAETGPTFRLGSVDRGNLESTISATGKLAAEKTVEVGTQVSGQIAAIFVDFNDRVTRGQLIARIDPTLQQQAVQDAQVSLERAQAQLTQTRFEFERAQGLRRQAIVSEADFETAAANFAVAKANAFSAQINLDRARQNLAYTDIFAPIDGVVIERNVDVGQTVAASLAAPQLFLIANDLSRMQILASVDESDIGLIREGQQVKFSVQSFPNETFFGSVRQVRLNSATSNNVVNYTVVVKVQNPDGRLLPGMTTTLKFVTGKVENVFTVPNAALRFRPDPSLIARPEGPPPGPRPPARPPETGHAKPPGLSMLWRLGADGALTGVPVRVGISDGQRTQVEGEGLAAGLSIVLGTNTATKDTSASETARNPFQTQGGPGPGPGGGPPPGPPGGF